MTEHDAQQRFYYADGQKVMLEPSRRFVAVQRPEEAERSDEPAAAVATALAPFADGARVLDLPEHGLAVIVLPTNGNGAAGAAPPVSTVRAAVAAAADVAAGPEVYETTEAGPEALVAIDEVLVKFKEETAEDARSRLLGTPPSGDQGGRLSRARLLPRDDRGREGSDRGREHAARERRRRVRRAALRRPHAAARGRRRRERRHDAAAAAVRPAGGGRRERRARDRRRRGGDRDAGGRPAAPPTDPGYPSQWGLRKIRAPEAWDITMGRPDISVAIIDEGCDLSHEDLDFKTPG